MPQMSAASAALGNLRRTGAAAAILFGSLTLSLLFLEIGVRLYDGIPVGSMENFVARELDGVHKRGGPGVYDARFGWISMPNSTWEGRYTFGEYGARMSAPQIVPLQQGAILVVGDSFAAGAEVQDVDAWPAQLERLSGSQVINMAVGGYGFDQTVMRAEDLLPRLKPRMLLVQTQLAFGISATRMSIFGGAPKPYFMIREGKLVLENEPVPRYAARSGDIGRMRSVLGHSYLVQYAMTRLDLLQWWVSRAMTTQFALTESDAVDVTCLLIRRLREFRDRYSIPVAIVLQYGGPEGTVSTLSWEDNHARVTACAERERLDVVDTLGALQSAYHTGLDSYQRLWVMHDNNRLYGHMSAEGNRLVADLVFQRVFNSQSHVMKTP